MSISGNTSDNGNPEPIQKSTQSRANWIKKYAHTGVNMRQNGCIKQFMELCYTGMMSPEEQIWRTWARGFHRWGLSELIASVLEATAPLGTLGAQLVYVCQPAMRSIVSENQVNALTELLDSDTGIHTFVNILRETE